VKKSSVVTICDPAPGRLDALVGQMAVEVFADRLVLVMIRFTIAACGIEPDAA